MESEPDPAEPASGLYSPLLEAAARLAARGHYHQFRKRPRTGDCPRPGVPLPPDCVPYVTHLMGSLCILARTGAADEVLAAALLHDYLEDVPDPAGQASIREATGERVLELVLAVTEDKRRHLAESDSWEERKREQIVHLAEIPVEAVMVKTADLLHNILSLLEDLAAGDDRSTVWSRFNAGPDRQLWYFRAVAAAVRRRLGRHVLVDELDRAVDAVAGHLPT